MRRAWFALALVVALVSAAPPSGDGAAWIKRPPADLFAGEGAREVEAGLIYEVVASKLITAELRDLKDRGSLGLSADDAAHYTGPYFACPPGKKPYLVRAVFGHGGTGKYFVRCVGRKLLVEHGSLGRSDQAHKSALIVNLDFEPEACFITVSIAE